MKQSYPDFFNDVFGPIMQPFSSSHTAAPCRIGYLANSLLDEPVRKIRIYTGPGGSFASSMKMMNVDLALLSGATGHLPDNKIMFEMPEYCKREGIDWEILLEELPETPHHSSARVVLTGESGKTVSLTANSTGGGVVETVLVNGYPLAAGGDGYVVLLFDAAGQDAAAMEQKLGLPLLDKGSAQNAGGKTLLWFATAEEITTEQARAATGHADTAVLRPVQAVIYKPDRKPQLFDSFTKWKQLAEQRGKELWEVAVQYEMDSSGWSREEVIAQMRDVVMKKMYRTSHALLEEDITPQGDPLHRPLLQAVGRIFRRPRQLCGGRHRQGRRLRAGGAGARAGHRVRARPHGRGRGLLFSGMSGVKETKGYSDEAIDVADDVGRALPDDLRGTSKGSFAGCPTGRACTKAFNEWNAQNA